MIRAQDLSPLDPTEEHTIFDDDFVSKTEVFSNQKYNRENHLLKSKNEFLSGIKKGETFTPVLTVVVYFMY